MGNDVNDIPFPPRKAKPVTPKQRSGGQTGGGGRINHSGSRNASRARGGSPTRGGGGSGKKPGGGDCCPMVAAVRSVRRGKFRLARRYAVMSMRAVF